MSDIEKVKAEIKKGLEVPVETQVEMLFKKCDPQNTGFVAVDSFMAALKEVQEGFKKKFEGMNLPKDAHEEAHKAHFAELLKANQTDGKMSKAQATSLFTAMMKGLKEHLEKDLEKLEASGKRLLEIIDDALN